jgi:MFS family permease
LSVIKKGADWAEYFELAAVFFLQGCATGTWLVPLSHVLQENGLATIRPYAYATWALAAFISPLIFGAMADRHASPARVLRWLAFASAAGAAVASWSMREHRSALLVLALIQLFSLAAVPTTSIVSTIVFARLRDSQRQFGPLRALATLGWMCGCWIISGLSIDSSPSAGFCDALIWVALAVFTYALPSVPPPASAPVTLRQRMGWDSLALLRHHDHRVVFLTAAMFSVPLAAFYPFTPPQLQQLGFHHTAAWMSLGQITEIIAMFALAGLLTQWRLKWIFAAGLSFGALRYVFCSVNEKGWLLAGVTLHGFSFTLFFITAQIYLNERIEASWRARAQALMSLMNSGLGSLVGYLGSGFWFSLCGGPSATQWPRFWDGLALVVGIVLVSFLIAYRGRAVGFRKSATEQMQENAHK